MTILHLEQALADQNREADFWESRSLGLGLEFVDELEGAFDDIAKAPEGYVVVSRKGNLRRFVERRFQTAILYRYSKAEGLPDGRPRVIRSGSFLSRLLATCQRLVPAGPILYLRYGML